MKKIVLLGTPTHGNIGDAAIILAEEKFIKDNFSEYEFIKVPDEEIEDRIDELKNTLVDEDIILLHGGGNLGDEYIICENRRRMVIETFPNNKIILMPQTIHFNDSQYGKEELEKTKKIYNNHKKLTLIARETVSFEKMKQEFPEVNVILTPDIVMYLNETKNTPREGIIFAMRSDVEKVLTNEQTEKINKIAEKHFEKTSMTDTYHKEDSIVDETREKIFQDKLDEFRGAELVITDRLHGMIFATITSTPCIALGNYNHKIESSFEWLKSQKYIKFLKNIDNIEDTILELKQLKNCEYNNEFAIKEHKQIKNIINE